ncbi:PHP domain-containing protein [Candidatus Saccharibacteria bacterium]|nr:PHP domain-containing protein [Candidatus Saccharibacteria bacterium]
MIKIDLHTHSVFSVDGSISEEYYTQLLKDKTLNTIAITDHDEVAFALEMHNIHKENIIVGQEITTKQGEIIGLFLEKKIEPHQDIKQTIKDIKKQDGLVYIPHPFETVRSGITKATLETIKDEVDIVEAHNGRAVFQDKGPEATTWARLNNKVIASSSDAHGPAGIGTSYTVVKEQPTKETLVSLLKMARLETNRPPILSLLYPKYNRLRVKLKLNK